jgi:hypothetical protein
MDVAPLPPFLVADRSDSSGAALGVHRFVVLPEREFPVRLLPNRVGVDRARGQLRHDGR